MDGRVIAQLLYLIFCAFQSYLTGLLHRRKIQQCSITMKSIDKVCESIQSNVVHLAVEILQRSVGLEYVGECACTLYTKLLICMKSALLSRKKGGALTSDVQDA